MQEGEEKDLDLELWYACAGPIVNIPEENSTVFYFPQGHLEHERVEPTDDFLAEGYPAKILCRVESVKQLAERKTKEAYLKIRLVPEKNKDPVELEDSGVLVSEPKNSENSENSENSDNSENSENKFFFYAKTLSASDATQGAGLYIPEYVANKFFPQLDYQADTPVKMSVVKDIHGQSFNFKLIYRKGQCNHFLTTGWHSFLMKTKLLEGDSILFLKSENGVLHVGVRPTRRLGNQYEIIQALELARRGDPFDVVYYPGLNRPEFCVNAAVVNAALDVASRGSRFKMAIENEVICEGLQLISWAMGTVTDIKEADEHWPDSPWKQLEVWWDEKNFEDPYPLHVNPWMVQIEPDRQVQNNPTFSPSNKKLRIQQNDDHPIALTIDGAEKPHEQVSCLSTTDSANQDS